MYVRDIYETYLEHRNNKDIDIELGDISTKSKNEPEWIENIERIHEILKELQLKFNEFNIIRQKIGTPSFDDKKQELADIKNKKNEIRECLCKFQKEVNSLVSPKAINTQETIIKQNLQQMFRLELEQFLDKYQNLQKKLKVKVANQEYQETELDKSLDYRTDNSKIIVMDGQILEVFSDEEQETTELEAITLEIQNLSTMFNDIHTMIKQQGETLDQIEYCIDVADTNTQIAKKELVKAEKSQSSSKWKTIIICILILVTILIVIAFVRYIIYG